ncbi:hypothetical protein BDW_02115 [Bdellovibrio bacteriovorus W]|nr:hypothetical protein BDW_02115 [Bdellovibrio bacteriovorus W]
MHHELEEKLNQALKMLQQAEESIRENNISYSVEMEDLMILKELVKEQTRHENSSHTTR